jgi:hypothetical protein
MSIVYDCNLFDHAQVGIYQNLAKVLEAWRRMNGVKKVERNEMVVDRSVFHV